ncbi:MAG: hemolysin III family protein [Pseudonocardiaceae bacterium]|nr:hemolysin III family protein [Pseudonocardiaceae bacterium]
MLDRDLPAAQTSAPAATLVKPRLRGWIHLWSFVGSLATGAVLIALAASTVSTPAAVATAVYSVTVSALFGVSALYHVRSWASRRAHYWINRLDHAMIFVFIAGSYTPFATLAMPATTGTVVLFVIWAGALAGVVMKMLWPQAPRWFGVPIYIALGWVAVFVLPDLLSYAGVATLVLLLVGGLFYTAGGVMYALRRPDPWPETFGFHEFFHAATVLAAICHYIAVWLTMYA